MNATNPFFRGLTDFEIKRLLRIAYDGESKYELCKVHPSQDKYPDHFIIGDSCWFNKEHAYLRQDDQMPSLDVFDISESQEGSVIDVVYELTAKCGVTKVHVGDYPSRQDAQCVVEHLSFNNGAFSRCWEISNSHITEDAFNYIHQRGTADIDHVIFEPFVVHSMAAGLVLFNTPWTDANLKDICMSVDCYKEQLVHDQVPECLARLLLLAGEADVRVLIFDSEAPQLKGLPVYDW